MTHPKSNDVPVNSYKGLVLSKGSIVLVQMRCLVHTCQWMWEEEGKNQGQEHFIEEEASKGRQDLGVVQRAGWSEK